MKTYYQFSFADSVFAVVHVKDLGDAPNLDILLERPTLTFTYPRREGATMISVTVLTSKLRGVEHRVMDSRAGLDAELFPKVS